MLRWTDVAVVVVLGIFFGVLHMWRARRLTKDIDVTAAEFASRFYGQNDPRWNTAKILVDRLTDILDRRILSMNVGDELGKLYPDVDFEDVLIGVSRSTDLPLRPERVFVGTFESLVDQFS